MDNIDGDEYLVLDELIGLDGVLSYEALSVALWCLLKNIDNPSQILAKGIFYGGDCDTIGSLIGQMSGLLFGDIAVNTLWLENVENITNIFDKVNKFIEIHNRL